MSQDRAAALQPGQQSKTLSQNKYEKNREREQWEQNYPKNGTRIFLRSEGPVSSLKEHVEARHDGSHL